MGYRLEVRDGDLIAEVGRVIVTLRERGGEDAGWYMVTIRANGMGGVPLARSVFGAAEAFLVFGDALDHFGWDGPALRRVREDLGLPVTDCDLDLTCRIERFINHRCRCGTECYR